MSARKSRCCWARPGRNPGVALLAAALLVAAKGGSEATETSRKPPVESKPGVAASAEHAFAVELLGARQRQQVIAAATYGAYHDFRFTDGWRESGIRFEHRAVEDAGRTYQAAHYDHGNGLAAADVDGDGRTDLFFTTQLGSNQLWRNLGGGRFEDITERAGLRSADPIAVAAAFGDFDNDGDPDLFVSSVRRGNRLYENLGDGRFRDISDAAGVGYSGHSAGAVWVDLDRDGRLDLLVMNVGSFTREETGPGGFHRARPDAFQGHLFPARTELSLLYHNEGGGRFREVSKAWGFRDTGWTGDATFADLNQDGFPDLYVANMQGDDRFYENQGGKRLAERTAAYFPKTPWGAMGVKFFDANQDGRPDLVVTDMHSDMTQPQTELALSFGREVETAKSDPWCAVQWPESYYQGSANNLFGNAFYRAAGDGKYAELSEALGVETYWPWGVSVGDLNADGFEDLLVTAGMGYPFRYAINSVLLNEAGTRFLGSEFVLGVEPRADGRTEKPWFTLDCGGADRGHALCAGQTGSKEVWGTLSSRSSVIVDLDEDGDLDIVTHDFNDRPQVLFSDLAARRPIRFLKVQLTGTASNRDALGATVSVRAGGRTWTQYRDGKSGYLGQSSVPLYFGLGDAAAVEEVTVVWPAGGRQVVTNGIPRNGVLRLVEEAKR